jgi:hypothetical protein
MHPTTRIVGLGLLISSATCIGSDANAFDRRLAEGLSSGTNVQLVASTKAQKKPKQARKCVRMKSGKISCAYPA